jgi:hypothetical protein
MISGTLPRLMAINIIFDCPAHQTSRSLARMVARLLGSLLVAIGLIASVVAIPSGFVTLGHLIGIWQHEQVYPPDFPVHQIEIACAVSIIVAFLGLRYGRRIIRGHRRVVLFLRRFGYQGSMQVVTFAIANTIGSTWRLVTLDDAAIAPMGVDSSVRLAFGIGERLVRIAVGSGKGVMVSFKWITGAMWSVVALQAAVAAPEWRHLLVDGTFERYVRIYATVMQRRIPWAYFEPSLSGAFAVLMTAAAFAFVGLLVVMAALVALFPLFGIVVFASMSADALKKAEGEKKQTLLDAWHVRSTVSEISQRSRQTFAARLVVVSVASPIWQETVSAFASIAAASIIDISDPTENLLWELAELERLCAGRIILIGEHSRIAGWADGISQDEHRLSARLTELLGDRDVLAYTTDRKGMRRFARALFAKLSRAGRSRAGSP